MLCHTVNTISIFAVDHQFAVFSILYYHEDASMWDFVLNTATFRLNDGRSGRSVDGFYGRMTF